MDIIGKVDEFLETGDHHLDTGKILTGIMGMRYRPAGHHRHVRLGDYLIGGDVNHTMFVAEIAQYARQTVDAAIAKASGEPAKAIEHTYSANLAKTEICDMVASIVPRMEASKDPLTQWFLDHYPKQSLDVPTGTWSGVAPQANS